MTNNPADTLKGCREAFDKWFQENWQDVKFCPSFKEACQIAYTAAWQTRAPSEKPTGDRMLDVHDHTNDLLFRLDWWGNLHYEDGCKYAHDILLDYREKIVGCIEAAQPTTGDRVAALDEANEVVKFERIEYIQQGLIGWLIDDSAYAAINRLLNTLNAHPAPVTEEK